MADGITHDDVVSAAVRLLRTGGQHALAMRRIAGELGVQQSALYWHVENKQQLLGAVADRILSPVAMLDSGEWSIRIGGFLDRLRDELLRYPDGAELVATAFAFRLGGRKPFDLVTAELSRADFGDDDAHTGATVLLHFAYGFVTDEQQRRQAAALGAISAEPSDDRSALRADDFARGVDVIVAGLESRRTDTSSEAHAAPGRLAE